jgi:hypothetical protein
VVGCFRRAVSDPIEAGLRRNCGNIGAGAL